MTEKTPVTKDPQIRRGIIASVIASVIILVFIQPVLRLAWSAILAFGTRIFQGYIDSIYANAALGHKSYIDFILLILILSLFSGFSVGMLRVMTIAFKRRAPHLERRPRLSKRHLLIMFWILIIIFHLSVLSLIIPPYSDLQLNTSFQQRLTVLAPKLTDLEEEELKAAWASMQTRSHYEDIKLQMEEIAREHGITLPKTLWK